MWVRLLERVPDHQGLAWTKKDSLLSVGSVVNRLLVDNTLRNSVFYNHILKVCSAGQKMMTAPGQ